MQQTKTILIVDDELPIRMLFCQSLERCGFTVLEAANGPDALAVTNQYPQPIDVLVSDIVMPGMSGPQLARKICAVRPQVKVILISGFTECPTTMEKGWEFLQKPFPPSTLCAKLQQMCP